MTVTDNRDLACRRCESTGYPVFRSKQGVYYVPASGHEWDYFSRSVNYKLIYERIPLLKKNRGVA
jgi:hypothetical protein